MNSNDEGSRSGQTSPSMPATPATSNQLRRSPSQETVMTTITEASTQSLNYPGPPRNTRATTSEAGDAASTASPLETGLETLTQRLSMSRTTPPSTPPFGAHGRDDSSSTLTSLKEEEGKYSSSTAATDSGPSTPRALPSLKAPPRQTKTTNKKRPAESSSSPKTFEYSVWAMVAEEDTIAALKRMAMLAKDEHAHDPSKSVEKHYSARLAKLIKQAELGFDAAELEK